MKEITAVQCKQCKRLIPKELEYVIANTISITQKYKSGTQSTKVGVQDEVFCDGGCVAEYVKDHLKQF